MSKIIAKEKTLVIPGEVLAEGMDYVPGHDVFREGEKLVSSKLGLFNVEGRVIKVIPISGKYSPKKNDIIIGRISGYLMSGWRVDIGWAFDVNLTLRDAISEYVSDIKAVDLSKYFELGDYVITQITNVISGRYVDLSLKGPGLRKLGPGRIIQVAPSKVPRIIGKQASMINLIKDATGAKISVGQNGLIWISGPTPESELKTVETIRLIEKESHRQGLTDHIKEFLENKK